MARRDEQLRLTLHPGDPVCVTCAVMDGEQIDASLMVQLRIVICDDCVDDFGVAIEDAHVPAAS